MVFGFPIKARKIATLCFSPPERSRAFFFSRSSRWKFLKEDVGGQERRLFPPPPEKKREFDVLERRLFFKQIEMLIDERALVIAVIFFLLLRIESIRSLR
jgi:hypothetical protein